MSRLKSLLRVVTPNTCNTQQERHRTISDTIEHESPRLLPVAFADQRNTQQAVLRCCTPVAQHAHTAQQDYAEAYLERAAIMGYTAGIERVEAESLALIDIQWREFESLLAIVGPAYRTPEHEYAEMRAAARSDLACALVAYREVARQVDANE